MAEIWPKSLRQVDDDKLGVTWSDGHESVIPVRTIRLSCRCANCVEEMSGRPILDEKSVPADVRPVVINPVGRYALHISWSDGHTTGLTTYEHLRSLCPCPACRSEHA